MPANACPLPVPRWTSWGFGGRLKATIDTRILAPVERAFPAAAPIVQAVRNCGGCAADAARLDGDGSRGSPV